MKGATLVGLVYVILLLAGIVGWVMNIVTVVHLLSDPLTGFFVLRCIGILLFPLGAVLGYF